MYISYLLSTFVKRFDTSSMGTKLLKPMLAPSLNCALLCSPAPPNEEGGAWVIVGGAETMVGGAEVGRFSCERKGPWPPYGEARRARSKDGLLNEVHMTRRDVRENIKQGYSYQIVALD